MTDKTLNIYQRIHNVMRDVTTIQKESKKVNNQYTYVSHDEVTRVMHDSFVKHGIVMLPTVTECIENSYATTMKKKRWDATLKKQVETGEEESILISKTSVKIDIAFINIDNPSDKVLVQFPGMGIDNQDKGIGKAISYAVKYALLKTFCLETSDDVEKDNIEYKPAGRVSGEKKIEQSQAAHLDMLIKSTADKFTSEDMDKIREEYKKFGVRSHSDLNISQYNYIVDLIREMKDSLQKKVA